MNFDIIRQHAVAVKDVVDIQINENQQVVKFSMVGRVKFKEDTSRENLAHLAEIWKSIVDLMQITDYETEYQMTARNAIFS